MSKLWGGDAVSPPEVPGVNAWRSPPEFVCSARSAIHRAPASLAESGERPSLRAQVLPTALHARRTREPPGRRKGLRRHARRSPGHVLKKTNPSMRVSDSEAAGHAGHEGTRARLLAANDSRIADGLTPRSRARDRPDASVSVGERETPVANDTRASGHVPCSLPHQGRGGSPGYRSLLARAVRYPALCFKDARCASRSVPASGRGSGHRRRRRSRTSASTSTPRGDAYAHRAPHSLVRAENGPEWPAR
jgi:hypothetical protein